MTFSNALFFYALLFASCPNQAGHKSFRTAQLKRRSFSCRKSKLGQVGLGLTDPGSPSSQLQLKFSFVRNHKTFEKTFEKTHTVEQQGACTVSEGDSKHPVLTDSRTNGVNIPNSGFALSQLSVEPPAAWL